MHENGIKDKSWKRP